MDARDIAEELHAAGVEVQALDLPTQPYGMPAGRAAPGVAVLRLRGGACVHVPAPGQGYPYTSQRGTVNFRKVSGTYATLPELIAACRSLQR